MPAISSTVTPLAYDVVPPGAPFDFDYYAGATWGDVDDDGDPDLFVTDYFAGNRLYLNEPALGPGPSRMLMLADGAIDPDFAGAGEGAVFADFDNDGDLDLYVVNQGGSPNKLYENLGGFFDDVSAGSGVDDPDFGEGCTVGDVDGDGFLDIFLTNYGDPTDPFNPGAPNVLFLNAGGLEFADMTTEFGLPSVPGKSSACSLIDYDLDGDLDLFVGNEGSANSLFENVGGTYVDVAGLVGGPDLVDADGGTFGARWFDADSDGDLDLYVSNTASATSPDGVNKVFVSGVASGAKTLSLVPTGADSPAAGMSVSACDLDLDRDLDPRYGDIRRQRDLLRRAGRGVRRRTCRLPSRAVPRHHVLRDQLRLGHGWRSRSLLRRIRDGLRLREPRRRRSRSDGSHIEWGRQ